MWACECAPRPKTFYLAKIENVNAPIRCGLFCKVKYLENFAMASLTSSISSAIRRLAFKIFGAPGAFLAQGWILSLQIKTFYGTYKMSSSSLLFVYYFFKYVISILCHCELCHLSYKNGCFISFFNMSLLKSLWNLLTRPALHELYASGDCS